MMNYIKLSTTSGLLIAIVSLFACENINRRASDKDGQDSLIIKYTALQDSVNSNWQKMIDQDDAKHALMSRLLLEVSYTNNYDKEQFNELKEEIDQLKMMRYDQKTISNSSLIDMYDSATMSVGDHIIAFARNHPRYPDYPLMEELITEINGKNNFVLIDRIHYDNWVKELNAFTESNSKNIKEEIPDFKATKMPMFQLPS